MAYWIGIVSDPKKPNESAPLRIYCAILWYKTWRQRICPHSNPQSQIFFGKDAFMGLIRWDHPVLHGWALNPRAVSLDKSWEREERRWPCGDGARDWNDAATSKRVLGVIRRWKRQRVTLPRATGGEHGPAVKTSKIRGFYFRPLVYRTMREYISVRE